MVPGEGAIGLGGGESDQNLVQLDGIPDPNEFAFTIELLRPGATSPTNYLLRGTRAANGAPFQVRLIWAPPGGTMPFEATLTARQIDGL